MSMIIRPYPGFIIPTRRFVDVGVHVGQLQAKGRFKLIKRDAWGGYKSETPWFDNLVLDSGLNRWGTAQPIAGAAIGTGSSAPNISQTTLDTQVHYTTTAGTGHNATSNLGSSPYNNTRTHVYRTTLGALNGNYSEVGAGWSSGNMFSRALILDGGGSPTTISVTSTEQLDIVYQLSIYPPLADTSTNVTISGTNHTITGRAASVNDSTNAWAVNTLAVIQLANYGGNTVWTGALGAITSAPSGTGATTSPSLSHASYTNNSYSRTGTMTYSLTDGNLGGGIKSTYIHWNGIARFQYELSPNIAKDGTKTLALSYTISWSRRP